MTHESSRDRTSSSAASRATRVLKGIAGLCIVSVLGGCQLITLPIQLILAVVGLAGKLVPLVPLLLYQPVDAPPGFESDPSLEQGEVRLAPLDQLDQRMDTLKMLGDDVVLPALDRSTLDRPRDGHRLAGIVFVPTSRLESSASLRTVLAKLESQGYRVEVGDIVDGSKLGSEDMLEQARFVRESQRLGVAVVTPTALDSVETPASESELVSSLPSELTALLVDEE